MSIHKSLVSKTILKRDRNVLTRAERVKELEDKGKWKEGDSVFALPKVRIRKVKAGGKHKKAEKAAAAAAARAAEGEAAPAEGEEEAQDKKEKKE